MMFIWLLGLICFLIYIIIYKYIIKRVNNLVPTIPGALSVLENGIFKINLTDLYKRIMYIGNYTNENGGVTKFAYGPLVIYVISTPEDAYKVLFNCMEKMFVYSLIKPFVGSELVAASVPVWKRNRRIIENAFKQNILDGYIELFNEQAKRLTVAMADKLNKEFDFSEMITRNTLESVCQTTLGINLNDNNTTTNNYLRAVNRIMEIMTERVTYPWLFLNFIYRWTSLKKEQDENLKIISNLFDQVIKKRKAEYRDGLNNEGKTENTAEFRSSLDVLIENSVTKESEILSDLQLNHIINNLILAGFDTISPDLLITLINIGSYSKVQEAVYKEVRSVMGDNEVLTKANLKRLPFLVAVIKETLRLYPVGPIVARSTTADIQLEEYVLPADCHVIVHLWAVNRNKKYWGSDADKFKPERWLNESVPLVPSAFASFSLGRRNCVGKSYGMTYMKTILAHIIKKFKITADDKKLECELAVMMKPTRGHSIKLESRF